MPTLAKVEPNGPASGSPVEQKTNQSPGTKEPSKKESSTDDADPGATELGKKEPDAGDVDAEAPAVAAKRKSQLEFEEYTRNWLERVKSTKSRDEGKALLFELQWSEYLQYDQWHELRRSVIVHWFSMLHDAPPKKRLVFFGDTDFENWKTLEDFYFPTSIKCSVSGALLYDMAAWMLDMVAKYEPIAIVLVGGTADVIKGLEIERLSEVWPAILEAIGNIPFVYISTKPEAAKKRRKLQPFYRDVNELAQEAIADCANAAYADVYSLFEATSGQIVPPDDLCQPDVSLFSECGIALSEAGYSVWAAEVRKLLEEFGVDIPPAIELPRPPEPEPAPAQLIDNLEGGKLSDSPRQDSDNTSNNEVQRSSGPQQSVALNLEKLPEENMNNSVPPHSGEITKNKSPGPSEKDVSSKNSAEPGTNSRPKTSQKLQGESAGVSSRSDVNTGTSTKEVAEAQSLPTASQHDGSSESKHSAAAQNTSLSEDSQKLQGESAGVSSQSEIKSATSTTGPTEQVAQEPGKKRSGKAKRGNSNTMNELSALSKEHEKTGAGEESKKHSINSSTGDDAIKFRKACETNDLKAFVELLTSFEETKPPDKPMHIWATNPETVGALAGTQLAILAVKVDNTGRNWKNDIRLAGAIPPLCEFLNSDQQDRVETAVLAFSVLTTENPENVIAVYEAGAMPLLKKQLSVDNAGLQSTAATALRNIAVEDLKYRKEFANLGCVKSFVDILVLSAKPYPNMKHSELQLEYVLNLQDAIEDDDSKPIEEYAKLAIKAGAVDKLKKLLNYEDEEVRESAEELLLMLRSFKR